MNKQAPQPTTARNIAAEILQQLGGNRFIAMTGARNLSFADNGALTMHLRRNISGAKYLRIEINGSDLYNMIFRTQCKKDYSFPIVAQYENIYADQLQSIFTKVTGYNTTL
jgi:hypothetical protein